MNEVVGLVFTSLRPLGQHRLDAKLEAHMLFESLISAVFKSLFGAAGRRLLQIRGGSNIERQMSDVVDLWYRGLPSGFEFYPQSLSRMLHDEDLPSAKRDHLVSELEAGKLASASEWLDAFLDAWRSIVVRLRAEGAEPQPFFERAEADVLPHLQNLALAMERALAADPARALPAIWERVKGADPSASHLEQVWAHELACVAQRTGRIRIVGLNVAIPAEDALPLELVEREGPADKDRFQARFLSDHHAKAALVVGVPGLGKSTALRLITSRLAQTGRKVLLAGLGEVGRAVANGEKFEDAVADAACDGRHDLATRRAILRSAEVLLIDGLDEARGARSAVAEQLDLWAAQRSTRLIVASRPSPDLSTLLPAYQLFVLSPPPEHELLRFVGRVASTVGLDKGLLRRSRIAAHVKLEPELANPLLLGFLLALELSGQPSVVTSRTNLYARVLDLIAQSTRPDRPYRHEMNLREASLILDELAWTLQGDSIRDLADATTRTAAILPASRCGGRHPVVLLEDAISFWQERGVLQRSIHVHRDVIEFVHPTLEEFAAGRRLGRCLARGEQVSDSRARVCSDDVLAVAASFGGAPAVVDHFLAAPMDPERTLRCARVVRDAVLNDPTNGRVVRSLVDLIRDGLISTHTAEAGIELASLVSNRTIDAASVARQIGDHVSFAPGASRLAALAVRIACIGEGCGSADQLGAWIREEASAARDDCFDFSGAFRRRAYINELVPTAIRVVDRRVGEEAAAALVLDLFAGGRMSVAASQDILFWAQREDKRRVRAALESTHSKWSLDTNETERRTREMEGDLGLLSALERACDGIPTTATSDGSALKTFLDGTNLLEVAAVDLQYVFSSAEVRDALVPLLRAWVFALGISQGQLRADVERQRQRLQEGSFGYVLMGLPSVPVRQPEWTRVDFSDPGIAPPALLRWMRLRVVTPSVLALPLVAAHPDRAGVLDGIARLLESRNVPALMRMRALQSAVDDKALLTRVQEVLEAPWVAGVHHLLKLLDQATLKQQSIQNRLVEALATREVDTVECVLATWSRGEASAVALDAAEAALTWWIENRPPPEVRVGKAGHEIRSVPRTPLAALTRFLLDNARRSAEVMLSVPDADVRRIAIAFARGATSSVADLHALVSSGIDPEELISTNETELLREHEVTWLIQTAQSLEHPEGTRLTMIAALGSPHMIPTARAREVLQGLCADPSAAVRDRALVALRRRVTHP